MEISGIETLHPGGFQLTRHIAEITNMKEGLKVLDVSFKAFQNRKKFYKAVIDGKLGHCYIKGVYNFLYNNCTIQK